MNDILEELCRNLDCEIEERSRLLELVRREAVTIQTGDHRELDAILASVRERLGSLGEIETERSGLLDRAADLLGVPKDGFSLTEIASKVGAPHEAQLLERRDALREILRETLKRNRRNQYLLRFASEVVHDTLDLLTSDRGTERKIYGPEGKTGSSERQGTLFQAKV